MSKEWGIHHPKIAKNGQKCQFGPLHPFWLMTMAIFGVSTCILMSFSRYKKNWLNETIGKKVMPQKQSKNGPKMAKNANLPF